MSNKDLILGGAMFGSGGGGAGSDFTAATEKTTFTKIEGDDDFNITGFTEYGLYTMEERKQLPFSVYGRYIVENQPENYPECFYIYKADGSDHLIKGSDPIYYDGFEYEGTPDFTNHYKFYLDFELIPGEKGVVPAPEDINMSLTTSGWVQPIKEGIDRNQAEIVFINKDQTIDDLGNVKNLVFFESTNSPLLNWYWRKYEYPDEWREFDFTHEAGAQYWILETDDGTKQIDFYGISDYGIYPASCMMDIQESYNFSLCMKYHEGKASLLPPAYEGNNLYLGADGWTSVNAEGTYYNKWSWSGDTEYRLTSENVQGAINELNEKISNMSGGAPSGEGVLF